MFSFRRLTTIVTAAVACTMTATLGLSGVGAAGGAAPAKKYPRVLGLPVRHSERAQPDAGRELVPPAGHQRPVVQADEGTPEPR